MCSITNYYQMATQKPNTASVGTLFPQLTSGVIRAFI